MPILDFAAKKAIVLAPRRAQLFVLLRCDETILNLIFPFRHPPPLQTISEMSGHKTACQLSGSPIGESDCITIDFSHFLWTDTAAEAQITSPCAIHEAFGDLRHCASILHALTSSW